MTWAVRSGFGDEKERARPHTGVDIAMPEGTPLHSSCDGVVDKTVDNQVLGRGVIVRANDGTEYVYGHMAHVDVREGQPVHTGTLLGTSGATGNATGPHLHFGAIRGGRFVDPSNHVENVTRAAGGGSAPSVPDLLLHPDHMRDWTQGLVLEGMQSVGDLLLHLGYASALILSGVLIILRVLGFEHRWLKPGVVVGAYVLIRYMLA